MTGAAAEADALIIGGGPAGLATALELRRRGIRRVVVLDRDEAPGGVPRYTHHTGYGLRDLHRVMTGPAYAGRYVQLAQRAGVRLLAAATATGWAGPASIETTSPDGLASWRARAVVLATGCRERPRTARLVPGDRPAGILTTGALQQFADVYRLPVGHRAVVAGAEHVSFSAVHTLLRHGTSVAAVVTDLPQPQAYRALRLAAAGLRPIPVLTGTTIAAISGRPRVSGVIVQRPDGSHHSIECDTVVFTGDWIPDHELARRGGLPLAAGTRGPATDQCLRTPIPGVFAVGNLVHAAETADVAALSGRHAATAVAAYLGGVAWPAAPALAVRTTSPIRWVFPASLQPGAGPPPRGRLLLRVDVTITAQIEVRQGGRSLYTSTRKRLIPNRSISLPASWLADAQPGGGDLTVTLRP